MNKKTIVETWSTEATFDLGKALGEKAVPSQIVCLNGDLGTGKTVFSKGFAAGLGICQPITSPTFTIVNVYDEGRLPFYHFDVYRIEDPYELDEIGYEDYFYGQGVTMIEWSVLIEALLPNNVIKIEMTKDIMKGLDYRHIVIEGD